MEGPGYSGAAFFGAVILTLWFAPAAVVVALLELRAETDPRKRSQLRTWAWISGLWCALGVLLLLFAFAV
jgi:hypothetical protein